MLPELNPIELIFLAAFALIVIGPKELPGVLRKIGEWTARMRGLAAEFRASFDEMARQSELDELRKEVEALRTGQFLGDTKASLESTVGEINDHMSGNYWDASSHADPVQMFTDVSAAEADETAALPPPGARTKPLPTRTRKAAEGSPDAKAVRKPATRKSSANAAVDEPPVTVPARGPHPKLANAAKSFTPSAEPGADTLVASAEAPPAPKTPAAKRPAPKKPVPEKPTPNKPAPEAAEI